MHVGHTAIFQNPGQAISDYQLYQEDMAIAKEAADLGFGSVWGIEHHFTDYIMNPNVTQFLSYQKVVAMHEMFDICGNVSAFKFAGMPYVDARASLRLYAQEVMPLLKNLGSPAPFDSDEVIAPAFQVARQQRAA